MQDVPRTEVFDPQLGGWTSLANSKGTHRAGLASTAPPSGNDEGSLTSRAEAHFYSNRPGRDKLDLTGRDLLKVKMKMDLLETNWKASTAMRDTSMHD